MKTLCLSVNENSESKKRKLKSTSCPDLYQLQDAITKHNIHHKAAGKRAILFLIKEEKCYNKIYIK